MALPREHRKGAPPHGAESGAREAGRIHVTVFDVEDAGELGFPGLIGGGDVLAGVGFDGGNGGDMGSDAGGVDEQSARAS